MWERNVEGNLITGGHQDSKTFCKIFINWNALDYFCIFSLFIHSTLKFLHSINLIWMESLVNSLEKLFPVSQPFTDAPQAFTAHL